ncbi:hypothetical protein RLIN73S_05969 [Rhodanobacter lindaniclasticus]
MLRWLAAGAGDVVDTTFAKAQGPHAFNVRDLVMMDRVSDPRVSPDGRYAAFGVRSTDYAANKGVNAIYVLDLERKGAAPVKVVDKGSSARWSADGKSLFFVAPAKDVAQLWRVDLGADLSSHATPVQVSHAPLDIVDYKLAPDGKQVPLSYEVFTDCATLACTEQRIDARAQDKASGSLYKKLFVRHWDTWADGRRNQLFVGAFGADGQLPAEPTLLSRGIDGDIPSKPFGDASEFAFAPDGKSVYFDVRVAGTTEPWSTNFDVYRVPADGSAKPTNLTADNKAWDAYPVPSPDGKTLYYLAMKVPGFEADRFAIMARDLATGATREVDPRWDRSPGGLSISADGKTLYATADDEGQHPLFAIDPANGEVRSLSGQGSVGGYSLAAGKLLLARNDLKRPSDLYLAKADGRGLKQVTHFNAEDLKEAQVGDFEFFQFPGWNNETVQGYVVKPVDYQKGKTYPVAFIIHGGPQGAMTNSWSYRWNPQTYAGQGFAVVTINFHGSTGYGQKFTDSISGDWGGKPLEEPEAGLEGRAGQVQVPRRRPRLRAGRQLWRLHGVLDRRRVEPAVEVPGRPRRRVRRADDVLRHRGAVVRGARERRHPIRRAAELREVQPAQPRQGLARADDGDPFGQGLPHPRHPGPGRLHRAAAPRHPQRAAALPRREPLGAEAAQQCAMARRGECVAEAVDGKGRCFEVVTKSPSHPQGDSLRSPSGEGLGRGFGAGRSFGLRPEPSSALRAPSPNRRRVSKSYSSPIPSNSLRTGAGRPSASSSSRPYQRSCGSSATPG